MGVELRPPISAPVLALGAADASQHAVRVGPTLYLQDLDRRLSDRAPKHATGVAQFSPDGLARPWADADGRYLPGPRARRGADILWPILFDDDGGAVQSVGPADGALQPCRTAADVIL